MARRRFSRLAVRRILRQDKMTDFETYVFILCLIVFSLLTLLSIICVSTITHLWVKLIKNGLYDEKILKEHRKRLRKGMKKRSKFFDYAFSSMVCLIFVIFFLCSLAIQQNEDKTVGAIPVYRVVQTGSMAEKHKKNTYLENNGLDNQIQIFDLIRTEKLPDEMELKLYDIVVYEVDGILIVHRIVEIEEPNASHPDCRHFRLQGDAVEAADRFPVKYEQMRAIYTGTRIPFIGSFIFFMQSPAGWLCIGLIVFAMIATPIIEWSIERQKKKRLAIYSPITTEYYY